MQPPTPDPAPPPRVPARSGPPPRGRPRRRRRRRRRAAPRRTPTPAPTPSASSGMPRAEAAIRSQRRLRAPPPETRPDSVSAPSARSRSSESRSPKATPSSTARTSAPAVVAQLKPDERAARVRIGVGRALAREVREEEEPLGAGLPRRGLRDEGVERMRPERAARGTIRASRRRTASRPSPARCPARRGRTNGRGPPFRGRSRVGPRGRPRTSRARPRAHRAGRRRPRSRRPAGRPRLLQPACPGAGRPGRRRRGHGRLEHGREPRGRQLERVQHLRAPRAPLHVQEQRPGGVRGVHRPLARQAQADVVLREEDARDAGIGVGLVPAEPEQLGAVNPVSARFPVSAMEVGADALLDLIALGAGALVVPEDRRADLHGRRPVEDDEAVHLAREARCRRRDARSATSRSADSAARDPRLGILLGPAGLRRREPVAPGRDREHLALGRKRKRLDAGGADSRPTSAATARPPALGAQGGVDELVGADGVLARLRLEERLLVDPARDVQ